MEFKHLPEEMYKAVRGCEELFGTPAEFTVPFMLGIVNSAVAPYYNVESYKYGVRPTALYILAMAGTGAGKSTIEGALTAGGQKEWLKEEAKRNEEASEDYHNAFEIHKTRLNAWRKGVAEQKIDPVLDPKPDRPKPLRQYNYKIEKGTLNGFIQLLSARPYLLLQGSEGGEFFNSHSFTANGKDGGAEIMIGLTKLWGGEALDKNTGESQVFLENRRMCINIMLQKETILDIMRSTIFQRQGILNRFLWVETDAFDKPFWDTEKTDEEIEINSALIKPFADKVYKMFGDLPVQEGHKAIELQELPVIQSTKEAHKLMVDKLANKYNWKPHPEYSEHVLENYGGFRDRLHEHGIRIAATIARFNGNRAIQLKDAECAVELMEFFVEQRDKFEMPGYSRNDDVLDNAEKLWSWIKRNKNKPEKFKNKTKMRQNFRMFGQSLTEEDRISVLRELCIRGRLVYDEEKKQYDIGNIE